MGIWMRVPDVWISAGSLLIEKHKMLKKINKND